MTALEQPPPPAVFAAGLASLQAALGRGRRTGLVLRQVPAPRRLAPWAVAVQAELTRDGADLADGRFVVLHDPDGQEGWQGTTRVVALVQADVDADMAADPVLAEVSWSWLLEGLEQRGAVCAAVGGTVTRTVSARFGELADDPAAADVSEVEVRASWTALPGPGGLQLGDHLLAWCDLLCSTAGLPPPGVTALR